MSRTLPRYDTGSFAHLPGFFHALLTGGDSPLRGALDDALPQQVDQVIFFFVDAFGWRFFERFASHPTLRTLIDRGHVARLTSQFPSTTAAHMTTMTTNQMVGAHGVFEWQYYEPRLDAVYMPMMSSFAGDAWPETLRMAGVDAGALLPQRTFFQELAEQGIRTHAHLPKEVVPSTYSQVMSRGATLHAYKTTPEGLINLSRSTQANAGPAVHFLYYGDFDSLCHDYGPDSAQSDAELDAFWYAFDRYFLAEMAGKGQGAMPRTALIISADHGQIEVDPARTIYLNQLAGFERLSPLLRRNARGQMLTPGGSPRDVFLYLKPDEGGQGIRAEAQSLLATMLDGRAEVRLTSDLIAEGLFGSQPLTPALSARLGDLCILPHARESVWWYEKGRFEQKFYGHHGGLSPEEMEIPLLALGL